MAATGIKSITARYLKTRPSRLALDVGDAVPGRKPRERNAAVWGRTMRRRGCFTNDVMGWNCCGKPYQWLANETSEYWWLSPVCQKKSETLIIVKWIPKLFIFFPCFFQVNYMWIPNVPSTKRVFFPGFFSSGAKATTQTYDIFRAEHQGQGARHGIFFGGNGWNGHHSSPSVIISRVIIAII